MRILLTNDDGVESQGLHVLGAALAEVSQVYVAAPEEEQSGTGHGITVRRPLYAHLVEMPFARGAWAVSGLPADCVKLALEELLPERPDIVVSGINPGSNLGNDILYSGTVSAAMEGFLYGLPAIAVSATQRREGNTRAAAAFVRDTCVKWQSAHFKPRTLLNINVPGHEAGDIAGVAYTGMGWRWYEDVFTQEADEKGRPYYWMAGTPVERMADGTTDVEAVAKGYISITPLSFDLTNYAVLEQLRQENV